ncbi:hypothetical protein [Streptomyces scopuliridis]|uniref:hypothetical protein n=1 Tax=Streptomyces scopuliridis TaxID=452529 RepID=UPI003F54BCBA
MLRLTAVDRDRGPLLDAEHDAIRTADALRGSPHIRRHAEQMVWDVLYAAAADLRGFRQ